MSLHFRVRLDPGDLLYDSVPKPVAKPRARVRVLRVEKLHRGRDRIYTGRAQVAFYRTGRQATPVFGLPFMRGVKGLTRGTLTSDSTFIEIAPIAPGGNPPLRDIRDIERQRIPDPGLAAWGLAAAAAAVGVEFLRRTRRGTTVARPQPAVSPEVRPGPYESALARLAEIEREQWPARGDVARHYVGVADTLRRYLEDAQDVPALERTTSELRHALAAALADAGLRERCAALLREADLVKFACARPGSQAAERFAWDARALLDRWHAATRIATRESRPPAREATPEIPA